MLVSELLPESPSRTTISLRQVKGNWLLQALGHTLLKLSLWHLVLLLLLGSLGNQPRVLVFTSEQVLLMEGN